MSPSDGEPEDEEWDYFQDREASGVGLIVAAKIALKAYADESGIHDGAERCVIAGYFASPHKWRRFSGDWESYLNDAWPVFHAKEFFGCDGRPLDFQGAERFLDNLLGVIERHDIYPFAGEVVLRDWRGLSYGERRYLTGAYKRPSGKLHGGAPHRPYQLCFAHAVVEVAAAVKPGKKVEFVFDRQDQFAPLALELYQGSEDSLPKEHTRKLGGCTFEKKDDMPPLQVADLLAHCVYSRHDDPNPMRSRARLASAKGGFEVAIYDARSLEIILEMLSPEEREYLRSIEPPRHRGRR